MRLVMFDVDGTLTRTVASGDALFVRTLTEEFGITEVDTDWSNYSAATDSVIALEILRAHFQRLPTARELIRLEDGVVTRLEALLAETPRAVEPIEGALELVEALNADPERHFVIASGGWRSVQEVKLRAAGFSVEGVVSAYADDGLSRDQILNVAGERGRYRYRQVFDGTVSVGDEIWDVQTAARLGIPFLGVATGETADRLRAAGARHVLPSFADLDQTLAVLDLAVPPAQD